MATIAELIAKLGLDNSKFNKGLKDSEDKLKGFGDEAEKSGKKAKDGLDGAARGTDSFGKAASSLKGMIANAFAADVLVGFGKQIINTTAEFQKMEAVLTNTLGSSSAAKVAMNDIAEFASKTPFAVNELTESFVKLANRGFKPTTDQLRALGDLASSTGKSFDQLTEAALDAMTGEFERLKEFGIRASANGDKVQFTFKGVTTEVQKTDEAIKDYLISLGDAEGVSGAMAAISDTVGGKISNLGDNFTMLYKTIGDSSGGLISGILDLSNALVSHLVKSLDAVNTVAEKTGESGFVTFFKRISAIVNPAYNASLQMQAQMFNAIDKAAVEASEGVKKVEETTKVLTEEEIKLAEKRKKNHEDRIKQLRKESDEFANHIKSLSTLSSRDAFGQPADTNKNVAPERLNMMKNASERILQINKEIAKTMPGVIIPQEALDRQAQFNYQQLQTNKELAIASTITSMLGGTLQSAFEGMLNSGKVSFRGIIDGLKALIIRLIAAAAAAFALAAILGGLGIGGFTLSGGGFMKGFKSLFSSMSGIPKFAKGGMVTGLTTAVLGDNPSGKEAVIPFERMGGFLRQFGTGSDNMRVEVVGSLRGEDIFFSGVNYQNGRNKLVMG